MCIILMTCLIHNCTDSSSKLFNTPPAMSVLMNRVAPNAASNWEKIGISLEIPYSDIKTISRNKTADAVLCLAEVFDMWKKRGSPPYTWTTIISVLNAKIVGEVQLAKELEEWIQNSKIL